MLGSDLTGVNYEDDDDDDVDTVSFALESNWKIIRSTFSHKAQRRFWSTYSKLELWQTDRD